MFALPSGSDIIQLFTDWVDLTVTSRPHLLVGLTVINQSILNVKLRENRNNNPDNVYLFVQSRVWSVLTCICVWFFLYYTCKKVMIYLWNGWFNNWRQGKVKKFLAWWVFVRLSGSPIRYMTVLFKAVINPRGWVLMTAGIFLNWDYKCFQEMQQVNCLRPVKPQST